MFGGVVRLDRFAFWLPCTGHQAESRYDANNFVAHICNSPRPVPAQAIAPFRNPQDRPRALCSVLDARMFSRPYGDGTL
ncbi:hypothetical protein BMF35_a0909 [Aurantiacibacter gangjinensis]|nr:hypothetical protein BMF35_a0909 [Aurantiacibacter gangjinensis]